MVRESVLTRAGLGLVACGLTALVYLPAIDYPFVLDDRTIVLLNPSLVDLHDWRGILLYDRWHPLVNVSFAIDRAFSGISPLGFHITNGILHVVVVAFLFALTTRVRPGSDRRQTGVRPGSDRGQTTSRAWAAFAAAAAFGANPLTARSVAYVSARADLLFTAGLLVASMLAWGAARARSRARAVLAGIVMALALTAAPIGFAVTHGPARAYTVTAMLAFAAAWWSPPIFARWRAARVAGALAVAALVFTTHAALARWADPLQLWREEAGRAPESWTAHLGYAEALREAARCGDAKAEYRQALRLKPDLDDARKGLARCR